MGNRVFFTCPLPFPSRCARLLFPLCCCCPFCCRRRRRRRRREMGGCASPGWTSPAIPGPGGRHWSYRTFGSFRFAFCRCIERRGVGVFFFAISVEPFQGNAFCFVVFGASLLLLPYLEYVITHTRDAAAVRTSVAQFVFVVK